MNSCPFPGLRAVDHFAITVPDLEQAIAFFVDVIGGEHVYTTGVFDDPQGDWMQTHIAVHPRSRLRIAMVRLGEHTNLELMGYEAPDQTDAPPKNSDHSASHLCLYVDDISAAVDYLESIEGVTVLGSPTAVGEGQPNHGATFVYFTTPWGYQMEMITVPQGMAYERPGAPKLAQPGTWNNRRETK
jgi:catechol 2,3-dioxygenase-like lactoylglutathione lyase family enzyme